MSEVAAGANPKKPGCGAAGAAGGGCCGVVLGSGVNISDGGMSVSVGTPASASSGGLRRAAPVAEQRVAFSSGGVSFTITRVSEKVCARVCTGKKPGARTIDVERAAVARPHHDQRLARHNGPSRFLPQVTRGVGRGEVMNTIWRGGRGWLRCGRRRRRRRASRPACGAAAAAASGAARLEPTAREPLPRDEAGEQRGANAKAHACRRACEVAPS